MSAGGCRGWGRSLRRAVGDWYTSKDPDRLAYLMCKYQSRDGVSNRDVLRLCHPVAPTPAHQSLFRWAVAGISGMGPREVTRGKNGPAKVYPPACELPAIINAFEEAKRTEDTPAGRQTVIKLIREANLPRECIPTWALNNVDVWDALLHHSMPLTALVRNLGKMTNVGLLKPFSEASKLVASKLGDKEYIRKSRMHPISILLAAKQYAVGHGEKGKLSWGPVNTVTDALDRAFYMAFDNVEPSNKRTLIALDVSGSMDGNRVAGTSLTAREVAAAFALVTAKTEPEYAVCGFSAGHNANATMTSNGMGLQSYWSNFRWDAFNNPSIQLLDISACSRITEVADLAKNIPMGATDCALPMVWAAEHKLPIDVFYVYTDMESFAGPIHATQALRRYREKMGVNAKLAVVACTATSFTLADPTDPLQLDVVGFSTDTPAVLAEFAKL